MLTEEIYKNFLLPIEFDKSKKEIFNNLYEDLAVQIDQQHPIPLGCHGGAQADGGGRLADATLSVQYCGDHLCLPTSLEIIRAPTRVQPFGSGSRLPIVSPLGRS